MKLQRSKLMRGQAEKFCRCYDNGGMDEGGSFDQYTVCYTGRYRHKTERCQWYVGMSTYPFHPQGFGQHGESKPCESIDTNKSGFAPAIGRKNHLGTRIPFKTLPEDCKKLVVRDIIDLWS